MNKLKCFFMIPEITATASKEQNYYDDEYRQGYDDNHSPRTQIPPPGYGETPAIPSGTNTPKRPQENNPGLGLFLPNTLQEYLE